MSFQKECELLQQCDYQFRKRHPNIETVYIYIYMSFDILSFWIHHNGEMIVQRELNYFNEQNNLRE